MIGNGSMTAAAADMGISQPAISRLMADLAKEFDFQLFDKRDGRLVPSQEVRLLQPNIQRVLELMRQISDASKTSQSARQDICGSRACQGSQPATCPVLSHLSSKTAPASV